MFNPFTLVTSFLADYGWYLVGLAALSYYLWQKIQPRLEAWKLAREDAEYHKNPDKYLAHMEAVQRVRELQQKRMQEASERALEELKEKEERKRAELAERLQKYGTAAGGQKLGTADDDYLPLSGGASTSSYRPPKRSKCGSGGCGR